MKSLFLIPARGGSKGIPGKNIKKLAGVPLIHYSINFARQFTGDENICVSTDDDAIAENVQQLNYTVPFKRPSHLATDTAGSFEVIQHAVQFYKNEGKTYDAVVLLQPTSPFREKKHLDEALQLFSSKVDMVVSVKESPANPYFNLFEEDNEGFLRISKGKGDITRRQDAPKVYEYNGSIYIINVRTLEEKKSFSDFRRLVKYVMPEENSIDLDRPADWEYAEFIANGKR